MPGKVSVACNNDKIPRTTIKLRIRAISAKKPKDLYTNTIKIITATKPINAAIFPANIESAPRSGPTERSSKIISGAGNAPALKSTAKSAASSAENPPEI